MNKEQKVPLVSIVIANYNGEPYLGNCLGSLLAMDYPQERLGIIVVDNLSSDGSIEFIQANFPTVKVIKNTVNNYASANNLGIMDSKCDYVGFVNNDVSVDKRWLSELIKVIDSDGSIGCVGGKVLFIDGRVQSTGHQEFPNFYWGDKGLGEADLGQYAEIEEMSSLSGSAVLFRRKCLDDAGYFDEDFEMYLEDVDIFIRCRKNGWKIYYVPDAVAHHKFHGSITAERVEKYIRRNRLLLIAKHFPGKLGDAFAGKEVFSGDMSARLVGDLCGILPVVVSKLIKCHSLEVINEILPGILKNMQLIFNYERDRAIQYLNSEREKLQGLIEEKDRQIHDFVAGLQKTKEFWEGQKQEWETQKTNIEKTLQSLNLELERVKGIGDERQVWLKAIESNISILRAEKEKLGQELAVSKSESERAIRSLTYELKRIKDISDKRQSMVEILGSGMQKIIEEKNNLIHELTGREKEITQFRIVLREIRESETYRFINKPLWKILDFLKAVHLFPSGNREKKKDRFLVIKPQEVTLAQTQMAIKNLHTAFPDAAISLLANVSEREYEELNNIAFIDEKIYYSPGIKRLTRFELFKLSFTLPRKKWTTAFVLLGVNPPGYGGYHRAQILAWLSGSQKRCIYDVFSPTPLDILKQEKMGTFRGFMLLLQHGVCWLGSQILFAGFLVFFIIFIVGGIKVRRLIFKLSEVARKKIR